jgi:hypothetical protein
MKRLLVVRRAFLAAGLLFGGCTSALPDEASITGLHLTTASAYPENTPPTDVDVTLTDAARARDVYKATLALPAFPEGIYNCPADFGYTHPIAFMDGEAVSVTATLNTSGCRDVTIAGASSRRRSDDAYWALLAANLGVDESTLFTVPGQ